jgi:hypothetical protein
MNAIIIEKSIINKIGIIMSKSDIESISKKIEDLSNSTEIMNEQIKKTRENTVFDIEKSSNITTKQIFELLNELKDDNSRDKLD